MFIAAKFLAFLTQPLAWVVALLLLALLLLRRYPRASQRLIWSALTLLLLVGWKPLPDALMRPLERHYPGAIVPPELSDFAGLLVLGGALEPAYVIEGNQQSALNANAERMTAALPLLARYPHLQLLFTGGEGQWLTTGLSEAQRAQMFYASMGVPAQRLIFEDKSRTTFENAVFSAALKGVDKTRPWLLITSASHMPRAMGTFQKAGWNVTPYAVDFRTGLHTPLDQYAMAGGADRWQQVLHEYLGLLAYKLAGRL